MPKDVSKFSGFSSSLSVATAIFVGVLLGLLVTFVAIRQLWGFPDLWSLIVANIP